jgi:hypothetical protein
MLQLFFVSPLEKKKIYSNKVFLDEVVSSRAILLPKLKLLGFNALEVKHMLELRLSPKAVSVETLPHFDTCCFISDIAAAACSKLNDSQYFETYN